MLIYKTDWLNSNPVFYNSKTLKISHNINDVIDFRNLILDPEGFNNYLDFGYSVFEQTPVKYVKFLPPCSQISRKKGALVIKKLKDPTDSWKWKETKVEDVIKLIQRKIQAWEHSTKGNIIIPTSGGYDSRFLNCLVGDKKRIHSFTYGLSDDQSMSYEVVYAKELAKKLVTQWKQIPLGKFHTYFNDWDKLFGPSVHSHGMYQIEFYKKIQRIMGRDGSVLSGIFGDIWSGNFSYLTMNKPEDIYKLAYSHGLHADSKYSLLKSKRTSLNKYWNTNKKKLQKYQYQIVSLVRMKMMLIHYLLKVPRSLGFSVWSPFLDSEVCLSILNISVKKRLHREWQKEYFRRNECYFEDIALHRDYSNFLDYTALKKIPLIPLNTDILKEFIQSSIIEKINYRLFHQTLFDVCFHKLQKSYYFSILFSKLNIKDRLMESYVLYLQYKPIEKLLSKRL